MKKFIDSIFYCNLYTSLKGFLISIFITIAVLSYPVYLFVNWLVQGNHYFFQIFIVLITLIGIGIVIFLSLYILMINYILGYDNDDEDIYY